MGGVPLQCDRDKGADESELAMLERGGELAGVSGHKAPIAQFSAGIAGGNQLVEHLGVRDAFAAETGKFEGTPRTRGIGN